MKILWFSWKDIKNPLAGGAETMGNELAKRLVKDGHTVVFLTSGFPKSKSEEIIDGYKIIRLGNRWTVYWKAYQYYKKNLKNWADVVIDEMNTLPFFTNCYSKEKKFILAYQLCREVWFYEMFFPLSIVGYILEPIYLWLMRKMEVITISESTKKDFIKFGFDSDKIKIISVGTNIARPENLNTIEKYPHFTLLSLGAIRSMKRTLHQIKAFEIAKKIIPELEIKIAGGADNSYGRKVLEYIIQSQFSQSMEYLGRINEEKKIELMRKAHLICCTSIKEGWGLIINEANSQGTPAVVYNIDGLRDAVRKGETGFLCVENNPQCLAQKIREIYENKEEYAKIRNIAWNWSRELNFDKSYQEFLEVIK